MADILNETFDDVPEDFTAPTGKYRFEIRKYKTGVTPNGSPFVEFSVRPVAAFEIEEVDDSGNAITVDYVNDRLMDVYPVRHTLYMTEKSNKWTKKFFSEVLAMDTEGVPRRELFENAIGYQFDGYLERTVSEKGNQLTDIKSTWRVRD